jgi:2,3-bisphosphoglycerate-independent phosphoglycerate mutase
MGNSEVGHMTLGTGRVSKQPFVEIDDRFAKGVFSEIAAFQEGISHVRKNQTSLHLVGLFST